MVFDFDNIPSMLGPFQLQLFLMHRDGLEQKTLICRTKCP